VQDKKLLMEYRKPFKKGNANFQNFGFRQNILILVHQLVEQGAIHIRHFDSAKNFGGAKIFSGLLVPLEGAFLGEEDEGSVGLLLELELAPNHWPAGLIQSEDLGRVWRGEGRGERREERGERGEERRDTFKAEESSSAGLNTLYTAPVAPVPRSFSKWQPGNATGGKN
jgi:hypothetical protein